ncbi:MAG TPA: LysR substrate-binding domain-containing protein [Nocardioidaceae bacterium]|nr:LysR substrate-binding domain-containing protein [Nocardioidaceae bacterium]
MTADGAPEAEASLRIAFVPGVTPDKWARIWAERMPRAPLALSPVEVDQQTAVLYDARADMCFLRLPVGREDRERLHVIPLYREVAVVVAPKEHFVEAAEEVSVEDLADEHLLQDPDLVPEWRAVATEVRDGTRVPVPPITMKQAIETVAAGVGIVIVPMSVARLHHRKDVVHRPVVDVAQSQVGLAWRRDLDDPLLETFVGVVRGRSANSSRGTRPPTPRAEKAAARKQAAAKPRRPTRGRARRGR